MVIRYSRSKNKLFPQAAVFDLKLPDLSRLDRATIGENLVRHFLTLWEGDNAKGGLPILLRSAASNEYAANKLRELFASQVMPAIARAGSRATAPERAGLVASQLLGIALCRYVLKLPPVVALPQSIIVREVGWTIQRYATGS